MIKKSKWVLQQSNPEISAKIAKELDLNPLCGTVLYNRGITTVEEGKKFLHPQVSELHDPFLLKDMDKGVEIIEKVIKENGNLAEIII